MNWKLSLLQILSVSAFCGNFQHFPVSRLRSQLLCFDLNYVADMIFMMMFYAISLFCFSPYSWPVHQPKLDDLDGKYGML